MKLKKSNQAPKKRQRLSAEEAQARILEVAAGRLAEGGPEAIRLKDLADDLGISHPAILHHFGSREGLMDALEARAMKALEGDLMAESDGRAGLSLERVFATFGEQGHAELLAWRVLRGGEGVVDDASIMKNLTDRYQRVLESEAREAGREAPDYQDTAFWVRLAALAMFGEALIGPLLTQSAELPRPATAHKRFQDWLADLLDQHPRS